MLPDPVAHSLAHFDVEGRGIEVEIGNVLPGGLGRNDGTHRIVGVPVGVLGDPGIVPGGVVGHPVEHDGHTPVVSGGYETVEIGHGTELRIDGLIVAHRIGRAQGACPPQLPGGMDGHQPEHVTAQTPDGIQPLGQASEGTRRAD